jgi:hypothetical protein
MHDASSFRRMPATEILLLIKHESGPFRVLGSHLRALSSGPKFGMPALEVGSQLLIEYTGPDLQEPVCTPGVSTSSAAS